MAKEKDAPKETAANTDSNSTGNPLEQLMTDYRGAAKILGRTVPVVRRMVADGEIRVYKQEGRRKHAFKISELRQYVENL